jgi:catechol 2,3-dioxygenase-like lactoylglutathione lyase family enzyme
VIDHVDVRVSDRDASQRFYDTVLTVLGKEREDHPGASEWGDFSIVADGRPLAKSLHIAFYAPSRPSGASKRRRATRSASTSPATSRSSPPTPRSRTSAVVGQEAGR